MFYVGTGQLGLQLYRRAMIGLTGRSRSRVGWFCLSANSSVSPARLEALNVAESKHSRLQLTSPHPASPQSLINSIHYSQDLARRARDGEITHSECLTQYNQHLEMIYICRVLRQLFTERIIMMFPLPPPLYCGLSPLSDVTSCLMLGTLRCDLQ